MLREGSVPVLNLVSNLVSNLDGIYNRDNIYNKTTVGYSSEFRLVGGDQEKAENTIVWSAILARQKIQVRLINFPNLRDKFF